MTCVCLCVCVCRHDPPAQQTMKRTWTKAITNESFSMPLMSEAKKRKASSDVTAPHLVQESMIIPSPAKTDKIQTEQDHRANDKDVSKSISPPPVDKEVTQILNNSDKENKSLENEKAPLSKQVC